MLKNVHSITVEFEKAICKYVGSPFCVCVDNCCSALFLALTYEKIKFGHTELFLPSHTYPGVPCECKHAGYNIKWNQSDALLKGEYQLKPTVVWDSSLRFTSNMYRPGTHQCLSFTGPYKTLKLGKGGAILTDNKEAYEWFKKARFSGRGECSYHEDDFDKDGIIGWNFYLMPEIAARGLLLIQQFYNLDGTPKDNEDLCLPYPNLSKFKCYQQ